jgi:hypothetical protein
MHILCHCLCLNTRLKKWKLASPSPGYTRNWPRPPRPQPSIPPLSSLSSKFSFFSFCIPLELVGGACTHTHTFRRTRTLTHTQRARACTHTHTHTCIHTQGNDVNRRRPGRPRRPAGRSKLGGGGAFAGSRPEDAPQLLERVLHFPCRAVSFMPVTASATHFDMHPRILSPFRVLPVLHH